MKLNWGNYLVIGMGAFMLFIISMGIYMFAQTKDDYDKQYYEKGISFDKDYNRERQVFIDRAIPHITYGGGSMTIGFIAPAKGNLRFTRAADKRLDRLFKVESSGINNVIVLPLAGLAKGPYKLRFEWQSNLKQYLYEQDVYLK